MINGVPNLLKKQVRNTAITILGNLVGAAYDFLFPPPKWGIYFPGTSDIAMHVSSVVELDISGEAVVSNYPIERGSFTTYNKVLQPMYFGLRITRDGAEYLRSDMANWLMRERDEQSLFDVVTPTYTWQNVTLVSFREVKNARSGAAMMTVDCVFQEVRELPAEYTNSQISEPENQESTPTVRVSPVENRTVQATELPPL